MIFLLKWIFAIGLVIGVVLPGSAQFFLVPQLNTGLPAGTAREYGTAQIGYGAQVGYRITERWSAVVGYDRYRFELSAGLDDLDVNPMLLALFNLPEAFTLDLTVNVWNGGLRYSIPNRWFIPFVGVAASTNHITVEGYGLSVSRRYWGVAPIVGVEWPVAPRWSVLTDARLQTIFIQENIPFVDEIIKEHLVFVPLQVGVVFQIATR